MDSYHWAFNQEEMAKFDRATNEFRDAAATFAARAINDHSVRREYIRTAEQFSGDLLNQIKLGRKTPRAAAQEANQMRNVLLDSMRGKTSDIGRTIAGFLKKEGLTLPLLENKYALAMFSTQFDHLSPEQRNQVWCHIVKKAGQPRLAMNNFVRFSSRAGKGVFALTIVVIVYNVASSENPAATLGREAAMAGGAIAGAARLGPVGTVCGPYSIICVPILVFVGGVAGAYGTEWVFDRVWGH